MPKPGPLLIEALRSGTLASLAIMPLGWLFRALDLRIGHYGPKFAALYMSDPQPAWLFAQHLLIGWVSALPLLWMLLRGLGAQRPLLTGAVYGAIYYVLVNSLILPLYFADPLPWQLGWKTVAPSLLGHMAYGWVIALASRAFVARHGARPPLSLCKN
ncbi:MAG: hypothetical protein IV097_15115 [Burkholderiaceae bacterium]|nr:hypothetical protein [Burkholderiaceae bacterium]